MLSLAKEKGFHFDAVLFPSNVMDWSFRSFVHQVMPVALQQGIAVQTMKPMGGKFILESKTVSPAECLQYALRQPRRNDRQVRVIQDHRAFRFDSQEPAMARIMARIMARVSEAGQKLWLSERPLVCITSAAISNERKRSAWSYRSEVKINSSAPVSRNRCRNFS